MIYITDSSVLYTPLTKLNKNNSCMALKYKVFYNLIIE